MSATTQHAAVEALVALWTTTFAGTDTRVHDGPVNTDAVQYRAIYVGYDPLNDDDQAVSSQQHPAQLGGFRREEVGSIKCCIAAWSGDSTTTERRRLVAEILTTAEAAWRADMTLGGVVLDSNFGTDIQLVQHLTETGNEVFAVFNVDFRSRI